MKQFFSIPIMVALVALAGCGSNGNSSSGSGGAGGSGSAASGQSPTSTTTSSGGSSCGPGTSLCGATCVNTANDPANCGMCGKACAAGESCSMGQCSLVCVGGSTKCGAACVDTQNDPANCGMCGKACAAGESCSMGQCSLSCAGGTTKCGAACVDTQNDPANCGMCGKACAAGEVCSMGQCGLSCVGGATKCGNSCTNTANDPANCGICGKACAAGEVCSMGQCGLQCGGGTAKCGNSCVNTANDPMNCGGCNVVCPGAQNAAAVCTGGKCALACNPNFADCNASSADGCEANVKSDPFNCSTCGFWCPSVQNGAAACFNGTCGIGACNGGFGDCDNNPANGCETNTLSDNNNCNTCGNVCPAGVSCSNGACIGVPTYIGSYTLSQGPAWGTNPPTKTCQEACATVFGGSAASYSCSTTSAMVTHTNWVDGYADTSHCPGGSPVAENYKLNTFYDCGVFGCAYSAFVTDNCPSATNYCFQ